MTLSCQFSITPLTKTQSTTRTRDTQKHTRRHTCRHCLRLLACFLLKLKTMIYSVQQNSKSTLSDTPRYTSVYFCEMLQVSSWAMHSGAHVKGKLAFSNSAFMSIIEVCIYSSILIGYNFLQLRTLGSVEIWFFENLPPCGTQKHLL